ncbi:hypothetical protein [Spiroplasma sp. TIUS-1]|uniref:hypothetical protein n=1 Tax=Spiroplasma sp. TIUS-1 TaxID=216963 RepID=UPI0013A6CAD6|nr:hypothetical protein [Spiroplasma sp. TIUS-1]
MNLQNNNLNPRQYIYTKYAFSIGYFLLILAVFLFYLGPFSKDLIPAENIIITDIVILLISACLFIFFFTLRFSLHKKSNYKLNNKDKKWYILTVSLVVLSFLIVIIWLSIVKSVDKDKYLIWWILSLVSIALMSFSASVFEYLARFNEFSIVATKFEVKARENDLVIAQQYSADTATAENIFNSEEENLKDSEDKND